MIRTTAIVLLILSLAACSGGMSAGALSASTTMPTPTRKSPPAYLPSPATAGEFQFAACRFVLPDDIVEGEDVECGYLTVEERRDVKPPQQARLIRLAVAIFHPPGGATRPDAVIYLSGGPGASALELIRYQFDLMSLPVFTTGRDLVMFDQRGVGLSQPALDCPAFDELSLELLDRRVDGRQVDDQEIVNLFLKTLAACQEELSQVVDLSAYNSSASAADVNDLRRALGYQQVNLWGGSYGTRLALEVMRRYPQGLRSVVLDAVYPPDVDLYLEAPANFNRALERLFEACADNSVCGQTYPDLREVFFETVARLDANPVLGEIENPFTGEDYEAWMNGNTLLALTFQLLYDSKIRYLIPQYIYAASQGDYTAFNRARGTLMGLMGVSSRGMMFSVQCHEELAFSSPEEFRRTMARYPELGAMYESALLGGLAYRACDTWGAGQADASANQPVFSDIPTLLMSGEFDPITPPEWGRHAAETLENGYFYEYPGIGHGASAVEGCPSQMMVAFLEDPNTAPDDGCIAEMIKR
jgi:pimeloyl-ACP methyl ester carboxylesterase